MFRSLLTAYLALIALAGPALCCCSTAHEVERVAQLCQWLRADAEEVPAGCACQQKQRGECPQPAEAPHECPECPCKHQPDGVAQPIEQAMQLVFKQHLYDGSVHPVDVALLSAAASAEWSAGVLAENRLRAWHPFGRQILAAHQILRC